MNNNDLFTAVPSLNYISCAESGKQGIKTFVLRTHSLSDRLINGVIDNFNSYAVPFDPKAIENRTVFSFEKIFGNKNETVIEIGFGNGESFLKTAEKNRNTNFLGFEVYLNGFASCLTSAAEMKLSNVRVMRADVHDVLNNCISDSSVSGFSIYFPDPWPKKKHHKRRLINPDFVSLLSCKLKKGGVIHFATDIDDYAYEALDVLTSNLQLENKYSGFAPDSGTREHSVFEHKGIKAGRTIYDIVVLKK